MAEWMKVYELAEDTELVAAYRKATEGGEYGFIPQVAVFGTDEWWRAVESGEIPTQELSGPIAHPRAEGDCVAFQLKGGLDLWTPRGAVADFRDGATARIEFVEQKLRQEQFGRFGAAIPGGDVVKVPLRIWVEAGAER